METRNMPLRLNQPLQAQARRYDFDQKAFVPMPMWSIFSEEVREKLVALYRDAARTGLDGILFQDDLVMYHNEDFSPKAKALFEQETGTLLDPAVLYHGSFRSSSGRWYVREYSDTFWRWSRWKNRQLMQFTHKLIDAAREVNPKIQIALNFMYESVTDPENALAWLSQNLRESAKFPVDFFAIMAYHRQMKKELHLNDEATYEKIRTMTANLLTMVDDPNRILMKIQLQDWDTGSQVPATEVVEVLRRITGQGRVSLAFVPLTDSLPLEEIGRYAR
jgi:biofilm PGA synthesis lipoprotein PgaB